MPIKEQVTISEVIEILNEICQNDKEAISALLETRVPCNEKLANHPTVQVAAKSKTGPFTVGLLGILNGIFGSDDEQWGTISANFQVICPSDKNHKLPNIQVGDQCSFCRSKLQQGELIGFSDLGRR